MESLERIFKALGCASRLWILWLLKQHPLCVCEIMGILEITQTNASRHLSYLKSAGLVNSERQEQWVVYSLNEDLPQNLKQILELAIEIVSTLDKAEYYREKLLKIVGDKNYRLRRRHLGRFQSTMAEG